MLDNLNPAPFWFLNHRLEKPEILRQLQLMKECGVSGFFIHPRAGLLTPYGSDAWFDTVRFIVETAAKLELKAWLYDEDPFPSGAAGGRILMEHPEFAARQIVIKTVKPDSNGQFTADLGPHKLLSAVAVKSGPDDSIVEERDVSGAVGIIRDKWFASAWNSSYFSGMIDDFEFPHCRAETFYPQLRLETVLPAGEWTIYCAVAAIVQNDGKYGNSPDNLNPECVRRFIELTHDKYAETAGEYFGSTIPGIFTDEPSCGASPPWTPSLPEEFQREHGYPLEANLYHLSVNFGEASEKFREHYWKTVARLYKTNFFGQIADWCKQHNLLLCGHVICEEDPMKQITSGGSISSYQNHFDIPGFDHITPNIGNRKYPALNFGGRFIASAAKIHGHSLVLSECFGCNAFNFGFDGMRKVADWLFALGINFLVPHGFYYSYDGLRKNDAGKSFFFQDPEFANFKHFADYAGNICTRLSKGELSAEICLVNPVRQFRRQMPYDQVKAQKLRDNLYEACQFLLENHYRFIILDDDMLLENPEQANDFKAVIIPRGYDEKLPFATIEAESDTLDHTGAAPLPISTYASGAGVNDLLSLVKDHQDGQIIYIYNNSPNAGFFDFDRTATLYDGITNTEFRLSDGKFVIPGFTGVLLYAGRDDTSLPAYIPPETEIEPRSFEFDSAPEWEYKPPCKVVDTFINWEIKADEQKFRNQKFCLMRDMIGTELPHIISKQIRPIFDAAAPPASRYPVKAEFKATFTTGTRSEKLFLVIESDTLQGNCTLRLNGQHLHKADFSRRFFYDPFNLALDISDKLNHEENLLEIIWENANEFDGLTSAVYIIAE